jgi:hypothetical protein
MSIRKRWAFLVGINSYTDYSSLNYCVDDALHLEKLLKAAGYTVWCLHDRSDAKNGDGTPNRLFPTEKNIRGRFADFCELIQGDHSADDLLLVYFACHGSRKHDGTPRLIASDTQHSLENEAISITEIEQRMENSGAGCRMLMLDACQIGLGTSDLSSRAAPDRDLLTKIHEMAKGYALLAASSDHQDAKEWGGMKHGVFSYYVLSGLSGEADLGGKNYTTITDLAGYVVYHMQEWAADHHVSQVPRQRIEDNLGGFILIPKESQQKVAVFKPSDTASLPASSTPLIQSRGKSLATQVIESLWSLNYNQQLTKFSESIPEIDNGAIIAVQAESPLLQIWLVKRLLKKLPDPCANVYNKRCIIAANKVVGDFDLFWNELWQWLIRESSHDHRYSNHQEVLETLIEKYKSQDVVISIENWPSNIGSRRAKEIQKFRNQIINDFWYPLRKIMKEQCASSLPLYHRLVLCLMDVQGQTGNLGELGSEIPDSDGLIKLEPLSITKTELKRWILSNKLIKQAKNENEIKQFLDDFQTPESLESSETVIGEICVLCGLNDGIEAIREEWRLAG